VFTKVFTQVGVTRAESIGGRNTSNTEVTDDANEASDGYMEDARQAALAWATTQATA
jgi:hypothetical protein